MNASHLRAVWDSYLRIGFATPYGRTDGLTDVVVVFQPNLAANRTRANSSQPEVSQVGGR